VSEQEHQRVRAHYRQLIRSARYKFPKPGHRLEAPDERGVYIIYSPRGRVLHVGQTPRGKKGLRQRLGNHLQAGSSFVLHYLNGQGAKLRNGYAYQFLTLAKPRDRALLEAYAIGMLCPAHIGLGQLRE
jgi:hypothetical protein